MSRRRASHPSLSPSAIADRIVIARQRREPLRTGGTTDAYRLLDGAGDGVPGLAIDRYGPGAVLNVAADAGLGERDVSALAHVVLDLLRADGVVAVWVKAFPRDRSRLGGRTPGEASSPVPRAGRAHRDPVVVHEFGSRFEVRLHDGLSTGLFLDHRDHRRALAARPPGRALNLFAYTCAFAVPLAAAGWHVTNVDVSGRALAWGKRNVGLNGLEAADVRFLRRDAMTCLTAATRAGARYDLVILDPPTYGAPDARRGIPAWRSVEGYPALARAAVAVLAPGGAVFASTNTRELARTGVLHAVIAGALGRPPRALPLPSWPIDVTDRGRVAALLFMP